MKKSKLRLHLERFGRNALDNENLTIFHVCRPEIETAKGNKKMNSNLPSYKRKKIQYYIEKNTKLITISNTKQFVCMAWELITIAANSFYF